MTTTTPPLRSGEYYETYHGHLPEHLAAVHDALARGNERRGILYLLGDSTLDNKHWLFDPTREKRLQVNGDADVGGGGGPATATARDLTAPCLPSYEGAFAPGDSMVMDVAYHATESCDSLGVPFAALNCAIEESSVGERRDGGLLDQDRFVMERLTSEDYLVVSVGGNDIALKPTPGIIADMALITGFRSGGVLSPLHNLGRWSLRRKFTSGLLRYLGDVTGGGETSPRGIVVCALYYPSEVGSGWADGTLSLIGYDDDPRPIRDLIRYVYDGMTEAVRGMFPGVPVRQVRMYEALDPKDGGDYAVRVEPSVRGGAKIGRLIAEAVRDMEAELKGGG